MKPDYTTLARRFYLRHSFMADIWIQINFWLIAYLVFFAILYFVSRAVTSLYPQQVEVNFWENIVMAVIAATIFGTMLGAIDFVVERKLSGQSLGIEILVKGVLYLGTWYVVRSVALAVGETLDAKFIESPIVYYGGPYTENMFYAGSVYTAAMIIVVTFVKQMSAKFGPGVLLPMVFGKFRTPGIEERIFLFMDLKDSTFYAEKLGHIKFSQMIQDCFLDVNRVLPTCNAEVYQYVGDEVVLTWTKEEGLKDLNSIRFFFLFRDHLQKKKEHYESRYGFIPLFKAGAHVGSVTVAEVGHFKREIAYHGDTINTAARIQAVCNSYGKSCIISGELRESMKWNGGYTAIPLDTRKLKGKERKVNLFSVEREQ